MVGAANSHVLGSLTRTMDLTRRDFCTMRVLLEGLPLQEKQYEIGLGNLKLNANLIHCISFIVK